MIGLGGWASKPTRIHSIKIIQWGEGEFEPFSPSKVEQAMLLSYKAFGNSHLHFDHVYQDVIGHTSSLTITQVKDSLGGVALTVSST